MRHNSYKLFLNTEYHKERSLRQKITGSLQRNVTVFHGIDLAEGFLISDNDGHFTLHL